APATAYVQIAAISLGVEITVGVVADAEVPFERLRGTTGHEVDRSAQCAWPRRDWHVALRHLDGGEINRGESGKVGRLTVIGDVEGNAVDQEWHLQAVEPAQVDSILIACTASGTGSQREPGLDCERVGQTWQIERLDLRLRNDQRRWCKSLELPCGDRHG